MNLTAREEKFCQAVADGMTQRDAHKKAGYKATTPQSHAVHSTHLMKRPEIKARIQELRAGTSEAAIITRQEVVKFLADVIRTPLAGLNEESPLVQEVTRETRRVGRGDSAEDYEVIKVKMPGKLEAINHVNRMMGWNAPDRLELSGAVEILEFDVDANDE